MRISRYTRHYIQGLVPEFIVRQYQAGILAGNFNSSVMTVDLAGFSAMTEKLMHWDVEGVEILSAMIDRIFSPYIGHVHKQGGFIGWFAGDGFCAFYEGYDCLHRCLTAAVAIRDTFLACAEMQTPAGEFHVKVNIGVAAGPVAFHILELDSGVFYYFNGPALSRSARLGKMGTGNAVVIEPALADRMEGMDGCIFRQVADRLLLEKCPFSGTHRPTRAHVPGNVVADFLPPGIGAVESNEFRTIVACYIDMGQERLTPDRIGAVVKLARSYGGECKDVDISEKGSLLLLVFGAPVAPTQMLVRACDFALAAMAQVFAPKRISISTGQVFAGFLGTAQRAGYTVLGPVLNLGARMVVDAPAGEIIVGPKLAEQVRHLYTLRQAGKRRYHGFVGKLPVFHLRERRDWQVPLFSGQFLGRERELTACCRFIAAALQSPQPGVLTISGPAGIGKSRLLFEIKRSFNRQNIFWCFLPCRAGHLGAFSPVRAFLRTFFNQDGSRGHTGRTAFQETFAALLAQADEDAAKALNTSKAILQDFLGFHRAQKPSLSAAKEHERLCYGLQCLILGLSGIRPTVIVLEDSHWLDGDTRMWLAGLLAGEYPHGLALLSACRPQAQGESPLIPPKADMQKTIHLQGLRQAKINAFVQAIAGIGKNRSVPRETVTSLFRVTRGNPFFLEQLVVFMRDSNRFDEGLAIRSLEQVPASVQSVMQARIDTFPVEVKGLAKFAAVLGMEFSVHILKQMAPDIEISTALTLGVSLGLWTQIAADVYMFSHALIKETVYQMQMASERRRLHARAAGIMVNHYKDRLDEYSGQLARHFLTGGDRENGRKYLKLAVRNALDQYRNQEALGHIAGYLELYPLFYTQKQWQWNKRHKARFLAFAADEARELLDVFMWYAEALQNIGKTARALSLLQSIVVFADVRGDHLYSGRILGAVAGDYFRLNEYQKAEETYEQALSLAAQAQDGHTIRLLSMNKSALMVSMGRYKEAGALLHELLKESKQDGSTSMQARVYTNLGALSRCLGDYHRSLEYHRRQLAMARTLNNINGILIGLHNIGLNLSELGRFAEAEPYLQEQLELAKELGVPKEMAVVYGVLAANLLYQEKIDQALRYFKLEYALRRRMGHLMDAIRTMGNMGIAYFKQGDTQKALAAFDQQIAMSMDRGALPDAVVALHNKRTLHEKTGDYKQALASAEQVIELLRDSEDHWNLSLAMHDKACYLLQLGDSGRAARWNAQAFGYAREHGFKGVMHRCSLLQLDMLPENRRKHVQMVLYDRLRCSHSKGKQALIAHKLFHLTRDEAYREQAAALYRQVIKEEETVHYKECLDYLLEK